jgi:hypothetical protein
MNHASGTVASLYPELILWGARTVPLAVTWTFTRLVHIVRAENFVHVMRPGDIR